MTDLLSLFFLVQLPFSIIDLSGSRQTGADTFAIGLVFFVSTIVWLAGLKAANRIGIENQWKRLITIGFTFPMSVVGGFCGAILMMFVIHLITGNGPPGLPSKPNMILSFIGYAILTVAIYGSAHWVTKKSTMVQEMNEKRAP